MYLHISEKSRTFADIKDTLLTLLKIEIMKENNLPFSTEEILLAMNYVSYVIYNATKDKYEDEDGIFVNVQEFVKYIPYGEIPILESILQKTSIYSELDKKLLDWIIEE